MTERQLDIVMKYEGIYDTHVWMNALRLGILGASLRAQSEPYFMYQLRDTLRDTLLIEALHGCLDAPL